jgi:hypothetical protein
VRDLTQLEARHRRRHGHELGRREHGAPAARRRRRTRSRLTTSRCRGNRRRPSATTAAEVVGLTAAIVELAGAGPTPRKLKRNAGAPHSVIARAMTWVTLLSMVPPNSGCGWQATPKTRGSASTVGKLEPRFERAGRPATVRTSARVTAPCRRCRPS